MKRDYTIVCFGYTVTAIFAVVLPEQVFLPPNSKTEAAA